MPTGEVKSFDADKGFGFINSDDGTDVPSSPRAPYPPGPRRSRAAPESSSGSSRAEKGPSRWRCICSAGDGGGAIKAAAEHDPDLVVLDVMLPDMGGFTVTRKLRDSGRRAPIVFVTARDAVDDKIKGLTVGGDDYVTKPFSLEEVIARIRAVLRRTKGEVDEGAVLRFEDLELDEDTHDVRRAGQSIDTSPTEFKLLRYLMLNPNRVLSKSQ